MKYDSSSSNKPKKIVIIGAGAFGREILWTINDCNDASKEFEILGFIDDDPELKNSAVKNLPVIGDVEWLLSSDEKNLGCVLAIGDPEKKKKIIKKLEEHQKFDFPNIINPSVLLANDIELGVGVVIQQGTVISVDTKIGSHVWINYNCTLGHDCKIGDFVTLGPGVQLNGGSEVQDDVYVGSGAVTKDDIKIGRGSIIGSGSVIGKDIPEKSVYYAASGILKTFET
jgi:sugar O-acyltransferase (sialic acid O-acetyltransferase NeuD family)|tara:strand:- start:143 stop:823 length:681 start_codon:yes stop_codon:yes gene_type:complete